MNERLTDGGKAMLNIYGRKTGLLVTKGVIEDPVQATADEFKAAMTEQAARLAKLAERLGVEPLTSKELDSVVTVSYDGTNEFDVVELFARIIDKVEGEHE